jgi:hypothetical protein
MQGCKHRLLSGSLFGLLCVFVGLSLPAAAQNFGSVNIGSSATSTVTVSIPNGNTLSTISVVTQGAPNLDFTDAGGGTCAVGDSVSSCTVNVTFTPKYAGARNGAVVLSDTSGVIATVYLLGTGIGPQIAFPLNYPQSPQAIPVSLSPAFSATSVAVDGNGNLYLGGSPTNGSPGQTIVVKETLSGGSYTQSTIRSGLVNPSYLAVDGAGNIYINDTGTHTCSGCVPVNAAIYKETPFNGGYTETVINNGLAGSSIAVDGSGNIFGLNGSITLPTIPNGDTLDTLDSITVDGSGNLYIHAYLTVNIDVAYPTTYDGLIEEALSSGSNTPIWLGYGINPVGVQEETYYPQVSIQADARGVIYEWKYDSEYLAIEVPQGNGNYYNDAYENGYIYSLKTWL